jgi:uncharacterized membrane protein YgcG
MLYSVGARREILRTTTATIALLSAFPSLAAAEPVVVVQARRQGVTAEATVVVRDAAGVVARCTTTGGECEIRGLRAGRHAVSTEDGQGRESRPQTVMIPADGKVVLIVAVPPEPPAEGSGGGERGSGGPQSPGPRSPGAGSSGAPDGGAPVKRHAPHSGGGAPHRGTD